jgi:hypothetical protein
MILEMAIDQLDTLDEDATIFVKRPWSASSEARVSPLDKHSGVLAKLKADGFEYFLEVHVAREALGVFEPHVPTRAEKLRLLLYYAEHDAYPESAHP